MANKAISELPQAQNVNNQDLFVLEQSGIAKKLTAETFITEQGIIDALAEALDGHGGIQSVTLQSLSGRIRTYLITFTDGSATTFQVLDGTSIDRIEKTSTSGLVDTYTIFMSDGTTSFFQVTNGGYGLDRTLTMSNAAAPADLVGDLKTALTVNENGGYVEQTVTYTDGGYIADYSPGAVMPYNRWKYTDYIDISGTKNGKILIKMYSGSESEATDGGSYNAWYDANKNYVSNLTITNSYLDVPDNAVYIRLSCRSAYKQLLWLYYNGTHDIISTDGIDANYINFLTWNVGIFKDGTNKPTTEEAPAQIVAMKKMVGDKNPNFFNAQEYVDAVDTANTISSANLMKFKLPYKTNVGSNKCFSKLEILNAETITFTSGSDRYCRAYEVKFNNKTITIINAHLSIERDPSTYRNADIQQLITYMQTKEYVILSGDFNVASDAEYTPFTNAGFVLCNGGDFGWFDTWPVMENMWEGFTPDWPCNHLDNIIVSSNIVPQYAETVKCSVSDHTPFFAVLRID